MLVIMVDTSAPTLSPHYYLENFHRLCSSVEDQYGDILQVDERQVLTTFRSLSFAAQCLYVRLISRTGPWFRETRLEYAEIGPLAEVLDELQQLGFIECAQGLTCDEAAGLFTYPELSAIFSAQLPTPAGTTKKKFIAQLQQLDLSAGEILQLIVASKEQRIVQPQHAGFIELLQLLFFGNRHQDITEFVLQDLGVVNYFPYEVDKSRRQFSCREAINDYTAYAALADEHRRLIEGDCASELPELAESVLSTTSAHDSAITRRHRLCNQLARDLERSSHLELAAALYTQSERHPARERRARILERRESWNEAQALCLEILDGPWCEEEKDAASKILSRVQRKLGAPKSPARRDAFAELRLELPSGDERVELLSAEELAGTWTAVHYVENHLFNALFGLAFWEEIFQPVVGAFNHPFQAVPRDMYEKEFRTRREKSIDKRLGQLENADLTEILTRSYKRYFPYQSHWVNWRLIDLEMVQNATKVIPASHLLAIWQRMLFDPRENRKGFPDLIALGENMGEYCLYEIKGPGDALQDSQKRWLRFFQQQGIPAQVAWVSWEQ
jgi:FAN1, HTH domain/VRR-NUC domain